MSIFEDTLPASYAGVSFLMDRSNIEGGRKDAKKEFPNSDLQNIEDLGLAPRKFTIAGTITQDSNAENYKQRRDSFLRVLEKGGKDILVHPLYGRLSNIVVRTFTLSESFTDLGEAKFNISFEIDNSDGTPIASTDTLSIIESSTSSSLAKINQYVSENFSVSNRFPANFASAVGKVNDVLDEFESNTSFFQVAADGIDGFSEQLVELRSNVAALVTSPSTLVNSISTLFSTVDSLYSTEDQTFDVIQGFFSFGDEDEAAPIKQNTSGRIERAKNRNLINDLMKSQSLVRNYRNISEIEFTTISKLNHFEKVMEDQYQATISNSELDRETIDSITQVRVDVQGFFSKEKLNVSQIIEVKTHELPSRVIAYSYYGSSDLGLDIADLNEDMNVSFIKGDIEVFTE